MVIESKSIKGGFELGLYALGALLTKVGSFFPPSLPNVEGLVLELSFLYRKSFILQSLENFFAEHNLHNAVQKIGMLIHFKTRPDTRLP